MSSEVSGQIVDPSGQPVSSAPISELTNAQLRERIGMLHGFMRGRRDVLTNSLEGLVQGFTGAGRQDNIASYNPLYTSNLYAPLTSNFTLLTYLYSTHGVLQTMIDEPVLDALRDGLELSSKEVGEDGLGELEDFAEEIGAWDDLAHTLMWGSLYGGSGLVINAGQDPEKPLDENDIKRGRLEFYDANRWEFSGGNRAAANFLFYGQRLDATRVLTYGGKRAPSFLRATLNGWGMSELQRAVEDFNVWLRGRNVLYEILNEAKVDVYSIKDYASTLMLPGGEQTIRARVQMTNMLKNFCNALILDKEDDYKVVSNSFSGLADVMRENRIGISCATRMPFSKLWGTTAGSGGLANSGEDDMENYNAMITARIRKPAGPIIRKMLRLMMIACWGKEYDISYAWKPLRILSAKDQEEVNDRKQQRYERLYAVRLLTSKEMGDLLHKEKLVPIQTKAQRGELPEYTSLPSTDTMFGGEGEKDEEKPDGKQDSKEKDDAKTGKGEDTDNGKADDAAE